MNYKQHLSTINKSKWVNTMDYITVHHTATWLWSIWGVLRQLSVSTWTKAVSCHYVIDTNGDIYKIWEDSDILWHAWASKWGNLKGMNSYAIGIEVIWPLINWFTFEQRKAVRELVEDLREKHKIPKENVLRHADITQLWTYSIQKILWDWKRRARKIDIDSWFLNYSIWKPKYKDWKDWQNSLK